MQNTAYEMRISDWSSDVCSADLKNAGVVVDHPATLVTLGDLTGTGTLLACLGFVLMVALEQRRVPGAIIVTILLITAVGIALGVSERSEEHTSELQSLMRISYAVFCLKKKKDTINKYTTQ